MTCIVVFRRNDGTCWADYSESYAKRQGEIICRHIVATTGDHDALIREPGKWASERVQALALRARDELIAARKAVPAPVVKKQVYRAKTPREALPEKSGFWDFLRRVTHGR